MTKKDRELDWSIGKQLEQKDAEIDRLRTVLEEILDGFGLHHLSKFCRDKAASALTSAKQAGEA